MKFSGQVGIATEWEMSPGVFTESIEPRNCRGDLIRLNRRMNTSPVVPGLSMGNTFSFIADPYTLHNFLNIRYIRWRNVNWAATSVELQPPRILVTVGGPYNAQ